MPTLAVLKVLLGELTARQRVPRVPEPSLVMDDPANVEAYFRAGVSDRVLAPVYFYNCAQVCEVVRPGDLVLDLGCGPATQLAEIASLNPETQFTGIDLSESMIAQGRAHLAARGVSNVKLEIGDVTRLGGFADASVDAVISTLTLHHLPDFEALRSTLREVSRVLRPGGGVYLLDFGRLKSESSIRYFAYQYAERQSELFTIDYWNSLRAAFSLADFKTAYSETLAGKAALYSTFLAPYMVAIKSAPRRSYDPAVANRLDLMKASLAPNQLVDLKDLSAFFAFGGLRRTAFP